MYTHTHACFDIHTCISTKNHPRHLHAGHELGVLLRQAMEVGQHGLAALGPELRGAAADILSAASPDGMSTYRHTHTHV